MKKYFSYLTSLLFALPSVLVGIYLMYSYGISATIYVKNIIFLVLGFILTIFYRSANIHSKTKDIYFIIIISALLFVFPFLSAGIDGVHRWIQFGSISLNVAFIFLPILLISIYNLIKIGKQNFCYIFIITIAIILFLQPDASMMSAFCAAIIPIIFSNYKSKLKVCVVLVAIILCSIISWWNLDSLPPVVYVEDIIVLAEKSGHMHLLFSVMSLLILLLPFFKITSKQPKKVIAMSLGLFFLVLMLSTVFGNFPVPLMGYGISPIIGYMISVAYITKETE